MFEKLNHFNVKYGEYHSHALLCTFLTRTDSKTISIYVMHFTVFCQGGIYWLERSVVSAKLGKCKPYLFLKTKLELFCNCTYLQNLFLVFFFLFYYLLSLPLYGKGLTVITISSILACYLVCYSIATTPPQVESSQLMT